jgi:diguanylate cyclase (GGDEF)-like protein
MRTLSVSEPILAPSSKILQVLNDRASILEHEEILVGIAQGIPVGESLERISAFVRKRLDRALGVGVLGYHPSTHSFSALSRSAAEGQPWLPSLGELLNTGRRFPTDDPTYFRQRFVTSHVASPGPTDGRGSPGASGPAGTGPPPGDHTGVDQSWSACTTPVLDAEGSLLGVLGAYFADDQRLGTDEARMIELGAFTSSLALTRHRQDQAIAELANLDWTTGLENRLSLIRLADEELAEIKPDHLVGIVVVSTDELPGIADFYGHQTAEGVLREIARVLSAGMGEGRVVARSSDGAFAVLATVGNPSELMELAQNCHLSLRTPFEVNGVPFRISANVGVAWTGDAMTGEELLKRADLASSHAHRLGQGSTAHFDQSMIDKVTEVRQTIARLRLALEDGEIGVEYQPIVDLATGAIVGAEALARWEDESPSSFIPAAEQSGLIHEIGMSVLEQALWAAQPWLAARPEFSLHVNLSPAQLLRSDLVFAVATMLERYDVDPHHLVLELTEEAALSGDDALRTMDALTRHGVALSLDDFGTGYSSPGRLLTANFHTIKIDRSFVAVLERSPNDMKMARLLMAFGRELGIPVIAEGIETERQKELLLQMGCRLGQGFLLARPMPAAELTRMLENAPDTLRS